MLLPLVSLLLLALSSADFELLDYQDCAGNVICLVQKSCIVPDSTEFRTLIRWSGKIRGNLTNCTGIRFSKISLSEDNEYKFRVEMQIGWSEKDFKSFSAKFSHDYNDDIVYECSVLPETRDNKVPYIAHRIFPGLYHLSDSDDFTKVNINSNQDQLFANNMAICEIYITKMTLKGQTLPRFQTRMRIITKENIFTYENDDFWEMFDEIIIRGVGEPLTKQFIHYCILILLIYSITVYFLDRYCRRLQFTTLNREEMEEHFFPPARYRNKLNHFRMLRGQTTIEKEKNLGEILFPFFTIFRF